MKCSACIMFEPSGACQHSTDGGDPARTKWLLEENSKGTRWEWVAERSSLLGCENGHLHRGGPAPHLSPLPPPSADGRQCTVKQKNTGQSAEQSSLTERFCSAMWSGRGALHQPPPSKKGRTPPHHPSDLSLASPPLHLVTRYLLKR